MERAKIKGIIEAILFASGRVVTLDELVLSLEVDKKEISEIIEEMIKEGKEESRGIEIVCVNKGYTISSKREYHEYIYNIIDKRAKPNLSQAALEVLAIIAYNPRITRAEIDNIRGVGSDASLYRLLEHNLIEEAGKLDLPGKPMSYKTTENFLKKFGLNTLEDLPELPKYRVDENRQIVIDDLLEEQDVQENKLKQNGIEELDNSTKDKSTAELQEDIAKEESIEEGE